MTTTAYFSLWAGLFVLCAGLGFIPEPAGFFRFVLTALSVVFFIPPAMILRGKDRTALLVLRNLALSSLTLTVMLILGNFLSLMAPEWVGDLLHVMLTIVSAPMVCSGYWVLSLFLWACLLFASMQKLKK